MGSRKLLLVVLGIFLISFASAISITYPSNAEYGQNITYFDWDHSDINETSCWYSLDEGVNNYTMSTCDTRQDDSTIQSNQGNNTWTVWANDSLGVVHTVSVDFWIDSVAPVITILNPVSYTNGNNLALFVQLIETNPGYYASTIEIKRK